MKKCTYCGKEYPDEALVCDIDQTKLQSDKPELAADFESGKRTMYQEKRPTCVTVIGWAWIVTGALMCFSALMALFASIMIIGQVSAAQPDASQNMPGIFRFFPFLAVIQIGVAIFGIISGVNFLKLRAWARSALEILTWLVLIFVVGFMIFWIATWLWGTTSSHTPIGFSIMGAVMGVGVSATYGVPFAIMLKFLRGEKVKMAMRTAVEPLA